jgi:hypothetical protein
MFSREQAIAYGPRPVVRDQRCPYIQKARRINKKWNLGKNVFDSYFDILVSEQSVILGCRV